MSYKKWIGDKGEQIAADYLDELGFQIVERNYNTRYGEIDLVVQKDGELVFVEVKTRSNKAFGLPEASVTPEKLARIENAGLLWLEAHPDSLDNWRIDVIAILLDNNKMVDDIQHFINVV